MNSIYIEIEFFDFKNSGQVYPRGRTKYAYECMFVVRLCLNIGDYTAAEDQKAIVWSQGFDTIEEMNKFILNPFDYIPDFSVQYDWRYKKRVQNIIENSNIEITYALFYSEFYSENHQAFIESGIENHLLPIIKQYIYDSPTNHYSKTSYQP